MDMHPYIVIDAEGLRCPMPVLKARRALAAMRCGQVLQLSATDPVSPLDMQHFCNQAGHEMVSSTEKDGVFTFIIRCQND